MPKTITMRAAVSFEYHGEQVKAGQTFTPHTAAEAVVLKNRKQADFARASRPVAQPKPVPVTPVTPSRELETASLTASDDTPDPGDSPLTTSDAPTGRRARGRGGRGSYNRQDLRPQS